MRTPSLALVIAPFFAAVSLFSACVGSDTPVVDTKIDSSVPPVNDGGSADGGADGSDGAAAEVDGGPKRCTADQAFSSYKIVVEPMLNDIVGGRVVPGLGLLYTGTGASTTASRLFLLPENALATETIELVAPGGTAATLSVADAIKTGSGWRIVYAEGDIPLPPGFYGHRKLRVATLGTYPASGPNRTATLENPQDLPSTDEDMAEPQITSEGVLFSARNVAAGEPYPRTVALLDGAVVTTRSPQRKPIFEAAASRTSPFRVAGGPLYYAELNDSREVTKVRALLADGTSTDVPLNPPTAAVAPRYSGVTDVSPDECTVYFNAAFSADRPRSALWVATRKPK